MGNAMKALSKFVVVSGLVAADTPWWSAWRWWENEQAALFAGIEVLKLGYYLVRYRFGFFLGETKGE